MIIVRKLSKTRESEHRLVFLTPSCSGSVVRREALGPEERRKEGGEEEREGRRRGINPPLLVFS